VSVVKIFPFSEITTGNLGKSEESPVLIPTTSYMTFPRFVSLGKTGKSSDPDGEPTRAETLGELIW